jgi:hypothetical protein
MPITVNTQDSDIVEMMAIKAMEQADHDLLVRIDEQLKQMRLSYESDKLAHSVKIGEVDTRITKMEAAQVKRIDRMEEDLKRLNISRAQLYAIAGTVSAVFSLLIKIFWK